MHPDVFARLRAILVPYRDRLTVSSDEPANFELGIPAAPGDKHGMFVAAVRDGKAYASFHLMPVYAYPDLLDAMSPELRKRMQGKSCFNFSRIDEGLFAELAGLTDRGFEPFRQVGMKHESSRKRGSSGSKDST
jgi:hypothetical protein